MQAVRVLTLFVGVEGVDDQGQQLVDLSLSKHVIFRSQDRQEGSHAYRKKAAYCIPSSLFLSVGSLRSVCIASWDYQFNVHPRLDQVISEEEMGKTRKTPSDSTC